MFHTFLPAPYLVVAPVHCQETPSVSLAWDLRYFLAAAQVRAGHRICTLYDQAHHVLGSLDIIQLVVHAQDRVVPSVRVTTTSASLFMNPWSKPVYGRLLHQTAVRVTCVVATRAYVLAQTPQGRWTGRGWLACADLVAPAPVPVPAQVLVSDYLCARLGVNEQLDPTLGLEQLLPSILAPVCDMTPYYRAAHSWERGPAEQVRQPLIVYHTTRHRTVQQDIDETYTHPAVVQVDGLTRDTGPVTQRTVQYSSCRATCVVVQVVRTEQRAAIEHVSVVPSPILRLLGREYRLVAMACKTGPRSAGHWVAYVQTQSGWWCVDDARVTTVQAIDHVHNGVLFVYEDVRETLVDTPPSGLPNRGVACWANTCAQLVRHSPSIANALGVIGRLPSFGELCCLFEP